MDRLSRSRRSENMRQIRAKETQPELIVRAMLRDLKIYYRLHAKELPSKPDIVRRQGKRAVFVHGCFWHQHALEECLDGRLPKSNTVYWHAKLMRNASRDKEHQMALRELGWRVLVIWDCELKQPARIHHRLKTLFTDRRDPRSRALAD